jgi:hypothetical protein
MHSSTSSLRAQVRPAGPGGLASLRRRWVAAAVALAGLGLALTPVLGPLAQASAAPAATDTGFPEPFLGTPQFAHTAPTKLDSPDQLNQPIGPRAADEIAKAIGLNRKDTFSPQQYQEFITGGGKDGDKSQAELVDASVKILTNTVGHPLYSNVDGKVTQSVLASYGVFVSTDGWLMSPANLAAPTRQVNAVIAPAGYMNRWCLKNGCISALDTLYHSAYTSEVVYGTSAQQNADAAQLITNTKDGVSAVVGMSMGPALWIVNFALIWTLNPKLAQYMPARWAPLPPAVASALVAADSDTQHPGQVPYSEYASDFGVRS